jgi:hypothetical protein
MLSRHLSRRRLVDLAEGEPLRAGEGRHLERCTRCRADLDALAAARSAVREVPEVEPSPLFWAGFQQRVSRALEQQRGRPRYTRLGASIPFVRASRAAGLVALSAVALVLVAILLRTGVRRPAPGGFQAPRAVLAEHPPGGQPANATVDPLPADDPSWLIVIAAGDLDWDTAAAAGIAAAPGLAERLAAEMSPEEQTELERLLREQIALGPS